ncbi:MAG: FixH family protein [Cryomorphaceae bacterium]|nr:FixH family protein [Flavobacteriales bacterium]
MKINFGHKIAIVYTIFAVGMTSMLIMSMQYDHELVTEDYYENEVKYQGRKDAFHNMENAPFTAAVSHSDGKISINFSGLPANMAPTGTVSLYKPDKAALDEEHVLALDDKGTMNIVPRGIRGRYKVHVRFEAGGTDYFIKKEIVH